MTSIGHQLQSMLLRAVIFCCIALNSTVSSAQWWSIFAPRDYEDCAAGAEKSAPTKEARASLIAECDGKFAGRRKAGGGYTFYDFMQDRHFDIAGPNPTPDELKQMDEEYIAYLDRRRHSAIVAAIAEKQRQQAQADLEGGTPPTPSAPAPSKSMRSKPMLPKPATGSPMTTASINVPRPALGIPPSRPKTQRCNDNSLSCEWARLSSRVKRLFGSPAKAGHHERT
jgi:hypothetical protein